MELSHYLPSICANRNGSPLLVLSPLVPLLEVQLDFHKISSRFVLFSIALFFFPAISSPHPPIKQSFTHTQAAKHHPIDLIKQREEGAAAAEGGHGELAQIRWPSWPDEAPPLHRCRQGTHQEDRSRLSAQHRTQGPSFILPMLSPLLYINHNPRFCSPLLFWICRRLG